MDFTKFENLLDKHISTTVKSTGCVFKMNSFEKDKTKIRFYSNKDFDEKDFFGMSYNHITVFVNEEDVVQSISIHFREIINRTFYDLVNETYGEPDSILVEESREIVSKSSHGDDDFKQNLTKAKIKLKEGTFEDKPLHIIWEKDDFTIKALLRHKQNISEITFSKN